MSSPRRSLVFFACLFAVFLVGNLVAAAETVVRPAEVDTLFANPHKGWMAWGRSPERDPRFPVTVAYIRYNWMDLEPAEGEYRWERIDEPLAAWGERGARLAFRIMTTNAHSSGYYCSPQWLFEAGCNYHEYDRGGDDPTSGGRAITRIEPDYSDPIYLEKHAAFLAALGERYDGDPRIEFVDIGSYGIWGEWHTRNPSPWEVRRQIIDMYFDAFPTTPLVQMSDDVQALDYAISRGAGYRRDGVGSPWHEANWIGSQRYAEVEGFAENWQRRPVVFEWFGNYDYFLRREWSFDRAVAFMLENHVTFINDNIGNVPAEHWPQLEELHRRSGYRFVLREARHPESVAAGEGLTVAMQWSNVGVGKLYRPYRLALYLLDGEGRTVAETVQEEADLMRWLPGDHALSAALGVPADVAPGRYTVGLALVDPEEHRPAIALAVDLPEEGWLYRLSEVEVRGE